MSKNYAISDIFNYTYTGAVSATVTGVAAAVSEQFTITTTGAQATLAANDGKYFVIYNANDATGYYVWNDFGAAADPAPSGLTSIAVNTTAVASDAALATAINNAIVAIGGANVNFTSISVVGDVATIRTTGTGHTTDINNSTATIAPWGTIAVATTVQGTGAASASSGFLYRDAANNNEIRVLGASASVGQVLATTATNIIGWQDPTSAGTGTAFLARPTAAQTIASTALTVYTTVNFGTSTSPGIANAAFVSPLYTIPSTGIYYFSTQIEWSVAAKNNKGSRYTAIVLTPGGGETQLVLVKEQVNADKLIAMIQQATIIYNATAAQTIGVRVTQDSTINASVGVESKFFGWRII
jgi:hypothetical protein